MSIRVKGLPVEDPAPYPFIDNGRQGAENQSILIARPFQYLFRERELLETLRYFLVIEPPPLGEFHSATVALQQGDAEKALDLADLLTYRAGETFNSRAAALTPPQRPTASNACKPLSGTVLIGCFTVKGASPRRLIWDTSLRRMKVAGELETVAGMDDLDVSDRPAALPCLTDQSQAGLATLGLKQACRGGIGRNRTNDMPCL